MSLRGKSPSMDEIMSTSVASTLPHLVPIGRPSSGVTPNVVSMLLPSFMAAIDEPLPRWHVMIFVPLALPPRWSIALAETYL